MKVFTFSDIQFIYFSFVSCVILVSYLRNHCEIQGNEDFPFCLPLRVLYSLLLNLGLYLLELIFAYGMNKGPASHFACGYLVFSAAFVEKMVLSPLKGFGSIAKINRPYMGGVIPGLSLLFHWFTCVYFCQHHIVLITMTSQ